MVESAEEPVAQRILRLKAEGWDAMRRAEACEVERARQVARVRELAEQVDRLEACQLAPARAGKARRAGKGPRQ